MYGGEKDVKFNRDDVLSLQSLSKETVVMLLLAERVRSEAALKEARVESESLRRELSRIKKLSLTDSLTGVFNPTGMSEIVQNPDHGFVGQDRRCTSGNYLLVVDMDGLKPINDTLGHHAGDAALKATAEHLLKNTRSDDLVIRMGGDEFLVLLRGIDEAGGQKKLCHLKDGFDALHIDWDGKIVPVTASIGGAPFVPGNPVEAVIEIADKRMYADKRERGAGRVSAAPSAAGPKTP